MSTQSENNIAKFIRFGAPEVDRVAKDISADTIEGNPEQGVWIYSNDMKTGSRSGIWECAAGKFTAKMDGHTEFCHVLEGEAHITNLSDGNVHTVRAGDSFVMEEGFDTQWHVPKYIRKSFVLIDLVN